MDPKEQRTEAYLKIIESQGTLDGRFTDVHRIDPIGGYIQSISASRWRHFSIPDTSNHQANRPKC